MFFCLVLFYLDFLLQTKHNLIKRLLSLVCFMFFATIFNYLTLVVLLKMALLVEWIKQIIQRTACLCSKAWLLLLCVELESFVFEQIIDGFIGDTSHQFGKFTILDRWYVTRTTQIFKILKHHFSVGLLHICLWCSSVKKSCSQEWIYLIME